MNFVAVFQFLPLTTFLATYRLSSLFCQPTNNSCSWRLAFIVGGIAALAQTALFVGKKYELNPIMLAINCFLLCGGIGMAFGISIILEFYRNFMQTTLLIWLLIIGIMTTIFSKKGFAGIEHTSQSKVIKYSLILIFVTSLAIVWSLYFKNNFLFSIVIPFASVVLLRKLLLSIISKS